jgi:tetratricopeptide (TPR) repeat protein
MKAHFAGLGRRLGIAFEPPEDIVNELAYRYLAADSIQLAVATFRFNVAQHPQSANAWGRLGDGLERSGRRSEALESYQKAVALAERQGLESRDVPATRRTPRDTALRRKFEYYSDRHRGRVL